MGFTLSAHGDLVSPDVLGFWRDEVGYFGSHVARGDGIGASELYPFHSQRFDEVDDTSFGSVVGCLQLGYIDDVGTHAGGSNEASISEALEGFPMACGTLVLLPPPMLASILGAIERTVQICGDDLAVMPVVAIQHGALCPWDTSVRDKDVEAAVEFVDYGINGFFHLRVMRDINLVRPA